jgi:hypothetical protein
MRRKTNTQKEIFGSESLPVFFLPVTSFLDEKDGRRMMLIGSPPSAFEVKESVMIFPHMHIHASDQCIDKRSLLFRM